MNKTISRTGRKSLSTVVTVIVLVAVLGVNIVFSLIADKNMWQVDETVTRYTTDSERSLYTVSDAFIDLIGSSAVPMVDSVNAERAGRGEEPITVNLIFCNDRDKIYGNTYSRYVLYTALGLQKAFPDHVKVSFINVTKNPSAVQKYKVTSTTHIYPSNLIFEFGTEYRVYSMDYFFKKSDTSSTTPWAYNGEMDFSSAILAVTRAESPIACFTTNHGEDTENCHALKELVGKSGYVVEDLDFEHDDIPENCRLIITYDPQTDFHGFGNPGDTGISEIQKLDDFLDTACSFMLFVDNQTPSLTLLEEYLTEWGVKPTRVTNTETNVTENYTVRDETMKLDKDGYTVIGQYATVGLGASLTKDMRTVTYPAKVVFPNATAITEADGYSTVYVSAEEASDGVAYQYEHYYKNGVTRTFSDVFTTYESASAEVFNQTYEVATSRNLFSLMTLTSEERIVQETNYITTQDRSYVCVFGSTEFASDAILESAVYGNADVLAASLRGMGREVVPVKTLEFKAFKVYDADTKIDGQTASGNIWITVCMALIPALIVFGIGVTVTVKRKYK